MVSRLVVLTLLAAVLAVGVAAPASASPSAQFGVQDDAWLMYGSGSLQQRLATLDRLGVKIVRLTVRWDQVAARKPLNARNPNDAAYRWGAFARALQGLHAHRIAAMVTLYGTPRWANGGNAPNYLPTQNGFGDFAYAAARKFPWVHMWTVWNEPNTKTFSNPVSPTLYVSLLLNPAYAALHAASRANKVAGGVTSPRRTRSGISPLTYMAEMASAGAHLDAYAQNPYPGSPRETPNYDPCTSCDTLTMARLATIRADVTRYFGRRPLWLTEYGYQTDPPDPLFGVSFALQAAYEAEAAYKVWRTAGVTVLIHFLIRDEPGLGGWQSGLLTTTDLAKPSYQAFALPLVQLSRSGHTVKLWGQVRPGHGARVYTLQRLVGSRWTNVGGVKRTASSGTFVRTVSGYRGEQLRISTRTGVTSPGLVLH